MASGRQVTYTLNVNGNVSQVLSQYENAAQRLDGSMWGLQKTLSAFGVGLGAHYLKDFVKDAVNDISDFEVNMLRIKNASNDAADALRNNFFIRKEANDFRNEIESMADAFGKFLFRVKNADLTPNSSRQLFEDIVAVSKAGALSEAEELAVTNNIGKLMADGILMARPLRSIQQTHPQLLPFIADEMGLKSGEKDLFSDALGGGDADFESKIEKLNQLISTKLTKMHISSKDIMLSAVHRYRESVQEGLPETLTTLSSEMNDLHNAWFSFKEDLVMSNKDSLVNFFHDLKDGISWLKEHENDIKSWASTLGGLLKIFIEWRLAILALQAPALIIGFIKNQINDLTSSFALYSKSSTVLINDNTALVASNSALSASMTGVTQVNNSLINSDLALIVAENELAEKRIMLSEEMAAVDSASTQSRYKNSVRRVELFEYEKDAIWAVQNEYLAKNNAFNAEYEAVSAEHSAIINELNEKDRIAKSKYISEIAVLDVAQFEQRAEMMRLEEQRKIYHNAVIQDLDEIAFAKMQELENLKILNEKEKDEQLLLIRKSFQLQYDSLLKSDIAARVTYNNRMQVLRAQNLKSEEEFASMLNNGYNASSAKRTLSANLPNNWAMGYSSPSAGVLDKTSSLLSNAIMPVFIYGMAASVASQFFPKGKFSQDELGFLDVAIPGYGLGKARKIGIEDDVHRYIQEEIYINFGASKAYKPGWDLKGQIPKSELKKLNRDAHFMSGNSDRVLDPNGHELYDLILKYQKGLDANYPEKNIRLIDKFFPADNYGKRNIKDSDSYDILKQFFKLPFIGVGDEAKLLGNEKAKKDQKKYEDKDLKSKTSNLRGNSSHYITINIHDMIGMKNPTFTVNSMSDMKEIEKTIGDVMTKILTDVVNDSQHIGQ